jgi:hypothetical protein
VLLQSYHLNIDFRLLKKKGRKKSGKKVAT